MSVTVIASVSLRGMQAIVLCVAMALTVPLIRLKSKLVLTVSITVIVFEARLVDVFQTAIVRNTVSVSSNMDSI